MDVDFVALGGVAVELVEHEESVAFAPFLDISLLPSVCKRIFVSSHC